LTGYTAVLRSTRFACSRESHFGCPLRSWLLVAVWAGELEGLLPPYSGNLFPAFRSGRNSTLVECTVKRKSGTGAGFLVLGLAAPAKRGGPE